MWYLSPPVSACLQRNLMPLAQHGYTLVSPCTPWSKKLFSSVTGKSNVCAMNVHLFQVREGSSCVKTCVRTLLLAWSNFDTGKSTLSVSVMDCSMGCSIYSEWGGYSRTFS